MRFIYIKYYLILEYYVSHSIVIHLNDSNDKVHPDEYLTGR